MATEHNAAKNSFEEWWAQRVLSQMSSPLAKETARSAWEAGVASATVDLVGRSISKNRPPELVVRVRTQRQKVRFRIGAWFLRTGMWWLRDSGGETRINNEDWLPIPATAKNIHVLVQTDNEV
jgi:hypothetical protein